MGLLFLPLYATVLGFEAYGLIGVFSVLQAWVALTDLGLTPTIVREMSQFRAGVRSVQSVKDLLRSLEAIWVMFALLLAIGVVLSANWIAQSWLNPHQLSPDTVEGAIEMIGVVLAARWLEQIYRGALQGLQDFVWLNAAQVVLSTLRWGGAYALILVVPNVITFFLWQGFVAFISLGALVWRTHRVLPKSDKRGKFSLGVLREVRTFATGMFLSGLLSFLLMQSDKIVISKLLPLSSLGAYTLAANASAGLLQVMAPLSAVVFPRFMELVSRKDLTALAGTYQRACQWMAALIVPPALVLAIFPEAILLVWTGNQQIVASVAPILSVLALGTLANGLMSMPYFLQISYGWTGLAIRFNVVAVLLIIPATIWIVPRFGAIGAAYLWLLLNAAYLFVMSFLMYRKILTQCRRRWYVNAVGIPLALGLSLGLLLLRLVPSVDSRSGAAIVVMTVGAMFIGAVALSLPLVRQDVLTHLRHWRDARSSDSTTR